MPLTLPIILLLLTPQTKPADALALLNQVSQKYADAKSYHVEAIEEQTSTSELNRSWQKTFMAATVMPGGRYRYEGRFFAGNAVLVSDGTSEWEYLPDLTAYTKRAVSTDEASKKRPRPKEEIAAFNARAMVGILAHLAEALKSATFLHEETIAISGRNVECYVLHAADATDDFKVRHSASLREWTLWIDKSRGVVVKKVDRAEMEAGNGFAATTTETTMIYPVVELGQEQPASSFVLNAPAEALLVDELPSLATGARSLIIGRTAPELHLKAADGKVTELSSLRGKPVFLDFWASWCGPCKGLVPDLLKLYTQTAPLGLAWVGIDNDQNPEAADKFIAKESLPWPNYHDVDGSMGKAFQRNPIPLGVLIDARGNVVFYETAYQVGDLRAAIAKLGPEFAGIAKAGLASSSNPVKAPE